MRVRLFPPLCCPPLTLYRFNRCLAMSFSMLPSLLFASPSLFPPSLTGRTLMRSSSGCFLFCATLSILLTTQFSLFFFWCTCCLKEGKARRGPCRPDASDNILRVWKKHLLVKWDGFPFFFFFAFWTRNVSKHETAAEEACRGTALPTLYTRRLTYFAFYLF